MSTQFRQSVLATADERERVRTLVAKGQWKQAEPDTERFRRFAAKRIQTRTRSGAEAIQGNSLDFQPASFLTKGARVRRAVAYVEASFGTVSTTGSGFMISPCLFITNQHVIPNADAALGATISFDRELDEQGLPRPVTTFTLDPRRFALFSDEAELDYAIVAVGPRLSGPGTLEALGYCPLSNAPDKHVVGMNTNIIQHPLGQRKLISIRNNLLVARTETTLLYETDTQIGSSGSPVFNDDWDVVALHHYGEPFLRKVDDAGRPLPAEVNEGIRISALVQDLIRRRVEVPAEATALLDQALQSGVQSAAQTPRWPPVPQAPRMPPASQSELGAQGAPSAQVPQAPLVPRLGPPRRSPALPDARSSASTSEAFHPNSSSEVNAMSDSHPGTTVEVVIPLRISVSLDAAVAAPAGAQVFSASLARNAPANGQITAPTELPAAALRALAPARSLTRAAEAVKVDSDYSNRTGFITQFVPGVDIGLPTLTGDLAQQVAPLRATERDAAAGELKYEHFSVKLHRTRRMAIFTATNIDGETYLAVDRDSGEVKAAEGDRWFKDPRVSESFTLTQDFYSAWSTYFDRGHLTRRTDPTWGTQADAERANADTFHFTNCSPQHFRFNQNAKFWQGVERYILETGVLAQQQRRALCVFQGPIFDDSIDRWADDVQIPSSFFKVVVWMGQDRLKAVGLVVDQGPLLDEPRVNLGQPLAPSSVDVRQWRVAIDAIEKRTGLDFGAQVRAADTIQQSSQPVVGAEAMTGLLIRSLSDIVL